MSNKKTYESLLTICIGFALIAYFKKLPWLAILSIVLLILGLVSSVFRTKLHMLWHKLAEMLGYINGKLIFTLFFFALIVPISFFYQVTRKKTMKASSNFRERNHLYTADDLKHIF